MSHTRTVASYIVRADLLSRLDASLISELSDADTAIQDDVCADASDFCDSYLGDPVTDTVAIGRIRPHCLSIAMVDFMGRKFAGRFDPTIENRYNVAVDWLKMVQKNRSLLEGAKRPSQVPTQGASSGSETPVFVSDPEVINLLPYGTTWP